MSRSLDARIDILPAAQQEIWPSLAAAPRLSFVLYGGTAVALHLGHRTSVDFDFFSSAPFDKSAIEASFAFMPKARTIQEDRSTLAVSAMMPSGSVRVSFFGGMTIGRINAPLQTSDGVLLVASLALLPRCMARIPGSCCGRSAFSRTGICPGFPSAIKRSFAPREIASRRFPR
jgi:Nucleotidyl transferase AbiEii toxin, Type IV TA system